MILETKVALLGGVMKVDLNNMVCVLITGHNSPGHIPNWQEGSRQRSKGQESRYNQIAVQTKQETQTQQHEILTQKAAGVASRGGRRLERLLQEGHHGA